MKQFEHIVGFGGGGGGGGSSPTEDPNSLRSTQIAELVDCLGEGECEGLVDGLKSVYLDGVPIENPNGSRNFTGVDFQYTVGSPNQNVLPGLDAVYTEFPVDVEVWNTRNGVDGSIIRRIVKDDTDKVRVTVGIPALTQTDTGSGDIRGTSVEFAIDVQANNGGFVEKYRNTIAGKTTSLYSRSVIVDVAGLAKPIDIRVRRLTPDSSSSFLVNSMRWMTYAEIQSVRLKYPNTAISHLRFDAQQFSRIPSRAWDWKGLRIQVPSNYNPATRQYNIDIFGEPVVDGEGKPVEQPWNGTFKIAWTDNPAWCLYALVTTKRWGLGSYVGEELQDKWKLYEIAKYCDGLVPDGRGGMEPRFTCNTVIASREEAFNVLRDMAAIFRGMIYWGNSTVGYSQDAPSDAEMLYTPSNVIEGNFVYQDTSEREMHSVFICYWNDLKQNGKRVPEVYVDDDLVRKYGVREIELALIGCTSQGQAARMGRWARYSEQLEGETIQFQVGTDGAIVTPGKVFKVADPNVAGDRLGGRIVSASSTAVQIDDPVILQPDYVYTLTVVRSDPANPFKTITEERTVTNTTFGVPLSVLTVSPAFEAVPEAELIWILQNSDVQATTWRCTGVKEIAGKCQFEITGVRHNPSKFDAIELGLKLDEPLVSGIKADVAPPSDLQLVETVYFDGTVNKSRLTASWKPSREGLRHVVRYRRDTTWWEELPETSAQTIDIGPLEAGVYEVSVRSVNALGTYSENVQGQITIAGGRPGIRAVRLKSSAISFKVSADGASALPATIIIDADTGGLDGDVTWNVTSGTAVLTATGNSATLAYTDMATETVVIRASLTQNGATYSDALTVFKVRDGLAGNPGSPGTPGAPGTPGTPGTPGQSAASGMLTMDVIALPADGSGNVASYAGAFTSLMVFVGSTDDTTNGWSFSRVNGAGVDSTLADNKVTISSVAAATDTSYVDIVATKAGFSTITKRVNVTKVKTGPKGDSTPGTPGARGSVSVSRAITGMEWSDAEAVAALADYGYTSAVNLDMVTLFNIADAFVESRVYSGGMWLTVQAYIDGNMMINGTVGAQALNVNQLSSISANIGTITAGLLEANVLIASKLVGATGTFSGTLSAGVLNSAAFAPIVMGPYSSAGSYTINAPSVMPSNWNSIAMRYLIIGGGGSGGTTANVSSNGGFGRLSGGGGFSGGEKSGTINNITPGTSMTLTIGAGGAPVAYDNVSRYGNNGGATTLSGVDSAGGGAGGQQYVNGAQPMKSDLNQMIMVNFGSETGRGGSSSIGAGGVEVMSVVNNQQTWSGRDGGIGAGGAGTTNANGQVSGRGGNGYALIEFFDPNFVVTGNRYNNLVRWLDQRGFGTVPTNAR